MGGRGSATRRWAFRALLGVALVWALLPEAPARRIAQPAPLRIALVDHGYHVGLLLARDDLAAHAPALLARLAAHAPAARWFEIGWGDEGFYTQAATLGDVSPGLAAQALLWPTPSVMHVVALYAPPEQIFPAALLSSYRLDTDGLRRIAEHIEATWPAPGATPDAPLGPGLYGDSRFYRARPSYHLFRVCNHWLSDALNAAGLPSSSLWSTLPAGMLAELRWRVD